MYYVNCIVRETGELFLGSETPEIRWETLTANSARPSDTINYKDVYFLANIRSRLLSYSPWPVLSQRRTSNYRMLSINQLSVIVNQHLKEDTRYPMKWVIQESVISGRGLIATEDIQTGDVLFTDHPLVYGTRSGNVQRGCTVCNKIDWNSFFKCHKCALLLCSEECQKNDVHFNDCCVISSWPNKIPIEDIDDNIMSRALTPIRALLLEDDQKNFLTALQAHVSPQHGNEIRNLTEYFDIPAQDEDFMILVACVLDANAFQIATPYGKREMSLRGLYPVSALMNHSCVPNTRYIFDESHRMTVVAVKAIAAGSEIFTCYSGLLWGTPARRVYLYKTKHFSCTCDRCADPMERGTLLSALRCIDQNCPGYILPIEPLNFNTAWRCLECTLRIPSHIVRTLQSALGSLMGSLDFENICDLENFLLNRATKFIPKTNQIIVDLQCQIIWQLGESEGLRWQGEKNFN